MNLPQPPKPPLPAQTMPGPPAPPKEAGGPENGSQDPQEARQRLTLTASRAILRRSQALVAKLVTMEESLNPHVEEGSSGLKGELTEAYESLREAAKHIQHAHNKIYSVNKNLEDL